jgi:probable HAF family extracellular repeat protein
MTDLGVLEGYSCSEAHDINDNGQVVGSLYTPTYSAQHACVWSNGTVTDIGTLPGFSISTGSGINSSGQVTGFACDGSNFRAFLYSGKTMTNLGTLSGYTSSFGRAINANGDVVGDVVNADFTVNHAMIYSNGTMTDLNTLIHSPANWTLTVAYDINDSGQIVGAGIDADGNPHAVLLTPVPEPSTIVLLGIAAVSLFAWRRRAL